MAKRKLKNAGANPISTDEAGFVAFLEAHPNDATAHAAYADWLDEHGRRVEAAVQRAAAGLSEVRYKLRRNSDGLFSEGNYWTSKGKGWRQLSDLNKHLGSVRRRQATRGSSLDYLGTPLSELEVVVVEVRATEIAGMPLAVKKLPSDK